MPQPNTQVENQRAVFMGVILRLGEHADLRRAWEMHQKAPPLGRGKNSPAARLTAIQPPGAARVKGRLHNGDVPSHG